jgi:hypothetical protein
MAILLFKHKGETPLLSASGEPVRRWAVTIQQVALFPRDQPYVLATWSGFVEAVNGIAAEHFAWAQYDGPREGVFNIGATEVVAEGG